MIKKCIFFVLLLPGCLLSLLLHNDAMGFTREQLETFGANIEFIVQATPRYVWGGSSSIERGLDCSGAIYLAAKWAGMPVTRTTSLRMSAGLDGWVGNDIIDANARARLDLMFWTLKDHRPNGHVGVLLDRDHVAHASSTQGHATISPLEGVLREKLTAIRRLLGAEQ